MFNLVNIELITICFFFVVVFNLRNVSYTDFHT